MWKRNWSLSICAPLAMQYHMWRIQKEHFDEECMFKEGIFENYWTTYSALKWGFDKINQIPGNSNWSKLTLGCALKRWVLDRWLAPSGQHQVEIFSCQPIKHISAWHITINSRGHRVSSSKMKRTNPCCHFMPAPIEGLSSIHEMIDVPLLYWNLTNLTTI